MAGYYIGYNVTLKGFLSHFKVKMQSPTIGYALTLSDARREAKSRMDWDLKLKNAIVTSSSGKFYGEIVRGWAYDRNREKRDILIWRDLGSGKESILRPNGTLGERV